MKLTLILLFVGQNCLNSEATVTPINKNQTDSVINSLITKLVDADAVSDCVSQEQLQSTVKTAIAELDLLLDPFNFTLNFLKLQNSITSCREWLAALTDTAKEIVKEDRDYNFDLDKVRDIVNDLVTGIDGAKVGVKCILDDVGNTVQQTLDPDRDGDLVAALTRDRTREKEETHYEEPDDELNHQQGRIEKVIDDIDSVVDVLRALGESDGRTLAVLEETKRKMDGSCEAPSSELQRAAEDEMEPRAAESSDTSGCYNLDQVEAEMEEMVNNRLKSIEDAHFKNFFYTKAEDCGELYKRGVKKSIVAKVYPSTCQRMFPVKVTCDMETDEGGWTVVQRRGSYKNNATNFDRGWKDYKYGFGRFVKDFYLGNENIHLLTTSKNYSLRVDVEDFNGEKRFAKYDNVKVDSESKFYQMHLGNYDGNAGDGIKTGSYFSTRDRSHEKPLAECSEKYTGGWWWTDCAKDSNLNGRFIYSPVDDVTGEVGVKWVPFRGDLYSLKSSSISIRSDDFKESQ